MTNAVDEPIQVRRYLLLVLCEEEAVVLDEVLQRAANVHARKSLTSGRCKMDGWMLRTGHWALGTGMTRIYRLGGATLTRLASCSFVQMSMLPPKNATST